MLVLYVLVGELPLDSNPLGDFRRDSILDCPIRGNRSHANHKETDINNGKHNMQPLNINGHTVILYDDISELSIVRYSAFNKYMLIDSGIGTDMDSVASHLKKAMLYVNDEPDKTLGELKNMLQNIYFISERFNPEYLSFACLVKKLDGKDCNDLSEEGLKEVLDKLKEAKHVSIIEALAKLKKKLMTSYSSTSPNASL